MKAWHWMRKDRTLGFNDGRKVVNGCWLVHDGPLKMCSEGLHASRRIVDALDYAPGSVVCRVEMGGKIIEGDDKLVAEKRKVLWWIDADDLLWEYARRCALDVIHLWDAPPVVVRYLKTGDGSLRAAARDATLDAMRDAASAAAWDAARAAAWAAASAAAWDAASDKQNSRLTQMVCAAHRKAVER